MIKPTVGRVVLFKAYQTDSYPGAGQEDLQAAIITKVWSDSLVNLTVFDANGGTLGKTSVRLIQAGSDAPSDGYCTWMSYQIGQAAKTEEVQKQLDAAKA